MRIKSLFIISLVLSAFATQPASAIDYEVWTPDNTKGTNHTAADGSFKTFARPDEMTATFHIAGNSRMRLFTFHPRKLPGLISLA